MKHFVNKKRNLIVGGLVICFIGIVSVVGWGYAKFRTLSQPLNASEQTVSVKVASGESWQTAVQNLQDRGLISDGQAVMWYVQWRDLSLKPGEYQVPSSLTTKDLVGRLHTGPAREEVRITVPEGARISRVADLTSQKLDFSSQEFMKAAKGFDISEYAFIQGPSIQGYLFPDTYRFFKDASPDNVIDTMLANFNQKAQPLLNTNSTSLSAYEVLILASIVEKEVFRAADRRKAADVFLNRLEKDMKLESDATIEYLTGSGRTRSTYEDLQIESPYNTYQNKGLPPTPITNPGKQSIQAALNPEDTEYLYFLTSPPPEQRTIFAKTGQEHQRNVERYLE